MTRTAQQPEVPVISSLEYEALARQAYAGKVSRGSTWAPPGATHWRLVLRKSDGATVLEGIRVAGLSSSLEYVREQEKRS